MNRIESSAPQNRVHTFPYTDEGAHTAHTQQMCLIGFQLFLGWLCCCARFVARSVLACHTCCLSGFCMSVFLVCRCVFVFWVLVLWMPGSVFGCDVGRFLASCAVDVEQTHRALGVCSHVCVHYECMYIHIWFCVFVLWQSVWCVYRDNTNGWLIIEPVNAKFTVIIKNSFYFEEYSCLCT